MLIRQKILTNMLLAIFGGVAVVPAQAEDYDVVILNGRVMDLETNFDAARNVSVGGQGLYVSLLRDVVVAYFTMADGNGYNESMAHAIATSFN